MATFSAGVPRRHLYLNILQQPFRESNFLKTETLVLGTYETRQEYVFQLGWPINVPVRIKVPRQKDEKSKVSMVETNVIGVSFTCVKSRYTNFSKVGFQDLCEGWTFILK